MEVGTSLSEKDAPILSNLSSPVLLLACIAPTPSSLLSGRLICTRQSAGLPAKRQGAIREAVRSNIVEDCSSLLRGEYLEIGMSA